MSTTNILLNDDALFCQTLLFVENKDGVVVPMKLTPAQQLMYKNTSNRKVVLKARQMTSTTYWAARGFRKSITIPNHNAVLVAYEETVTQRMLDRARRMHQRMPLPESKKPRVHNNSANEMSFPDTQSRFYIGTAGAKVFGRGDTIHFFIGSEFAFWDEVTDAHKILDPIMQAVPLSGEIVLESTANGEGSAIRPNAFYEAVQDAISGQSFWDLIVLYWWLADEYKLPLRSPFALPQDRGLLSLTNEEYDLAAKAGWSGDQEVQERIRWRRLKLKELKGVFWQEYLEDSVSCFAATKEPFYDYDVLDILRKGAFDAPYSYYGADVWFPPANPELDVESYFKKIAEHPDALPERERGQYVVSVDPGQGKATRSVALVWRVDLDDYTSIRHEATLAGYLEPMAFAPMVKRLAAWYNNAKIIPEANGHGMSFCALVNDYSNLYYRSDVVSGKVGSHIGWLTTGAARIGSTGSKMYMLNELQQLILRGVVKTHDLNLIRELMQVRYSGGQILFLGSDDYHDSAAIMAATRSITQVNTRDYGFQGTTGFRF